MYAILQFGESAETIVYKDCGTVRSKKKKGYKVSPVKDNNREGNPETVAYKVSIEALSLDLNTTFLNADSHYFRLMFPRSLEMIELGLQDYTIDYDADIKFNNREYFLIKLSFIIEKTQFNTYRSRVPLPASEGGIIVEDSAIYIE